MPAKARGRKANTTDRGLGWPHQQQVAALLRKLVDGTLCWWCGLPMHRERLRNWDHKTLAGDHSVARVHGGKLCDRLLHGTCNSHRQDGRWDTHRPVLLGIHPRDWIAHMRKTGLMGDASTPTPAVPAELAMDW